MIACSNRRVVRQGTAQLGKLRLVLVHVCVLFSLCVCEDGGVASWAIATLGETLVEPDQL